MAEKRPAFELTRGESGEFRKRERNFFDGSKFNRQDVTKRLKSVSTARFRKTFQNYRKWQKSKNYGQKRGGVHKRAPPWWRYTGAAGQTAAPFLRSFGGVLVWRSAHSVECSFGGAQMRRAERGCIGQSTGASGRRCVGQGTCSAERSFGGAQMRRAERGRVGALVWRSADGAFGGARVWPVWLIIFMLSRKRKGQADLLRQGFSLFLVDPVCPAYLSSHSWSWLRSAEIPFNSARQTGSFL